MNTDQVKAVIFYAENIQIGDEFSMLAGTLADEVHSAGKNWVYTTTRACAALFKWQAFQFNGEWDQAALQEVINWLRFRVIVTDWEQYTPRSTSKPRDSKVKVPAGFETDRFANLEA